MAFSGKTFSKLYSYGAISSLGKRIFDSLLDEEWDGVATGLSELRSDMGDHQWFASRADVGSADISSHVDRIVTGGYGSVNDGGHGVYKRVASEPSHAGKVQSDDGAWWELTGTTARPRQFGAAGDGSTDDTTAIQDCIDYIEAIVSDTSFQDVGDGYYIVDGEGLRYGTSAALNVTKKIILERLNLTALEAFPAGTGTNSFMLTVQGFQSQRMIIRDCDFDCGLDAADDSVRYANGIYIDDCNRGVLANCFIEHGRDYGVYMDDCQGFYVVGCIIREYNNADPAPEDSSNWGSVGLYVGAASDDNIFHAINVSGCLTGVEIHSSANLWTLCHFVTFANRTDGANGFACVLIDSSTDTAVDNHFVGCYFDAGELHIKGDFKQQFSGCFFVEGTGSFLQTAVRLTATAANTFLAGLKMDATFNNFGTVAMFTQDTEGAGSWDSNSNPAKDCQVWAFKGGFLNADDLFLPEIDGPVVFGYLDHTLITALGEKKAIVNSVTTLGAQTYVAASGTPTDLPVTHRLIRKQMNSGNESWTLPDGEPGQVLTILIVQGTDTLTINPTTSTGWSSDTLSGVGSALTLEYLDDNRGWIRTGKV